MKGGSDVELSTHRSAASYGRSAFVSSVAAAGSMAMLTSAGDFETQFGVVSRRRDGILANTTSEKYDSQDHMIPCIIYFVNMHIKILPSWCSGYVGSYTYFILHEVLGSIPRIVTFVFLD